MDFLNEIPMDFLNEIPMDFLNEFPVDFSNEIHLPRVALFRRNPEDTVDV
jgi:hypothetical protein